jgi:uncharacterized protein
MKFQPDTFDNGNAITRQGPGEVWVNGQRHAQSIVLPWRGEVQAWPLAAWSDLTTTHFDQVAALKPELVIFGSGPRLQFIAPALYRVLIDARIGMETMDTAAACRTYNVLASEGRSVVAALILGV